MKQNNDIIYGRQPVLEWLEFGLPIKQLILSQEAGGIPIRDILHLAEIRKIDIQRLRASKLEQLAGTEKHQNILAKVDLPSYADIDDIFITAEKKKEPPLIAILDGVQDPHNLGAILRTADAAGIHGVILPKDKAVGITPTVVKSSAGAAAFVPVAPVTNLTRTIEELKKRGLWIAGAADDADKSYSEIDFKGPSAIILGSEGKGMRRLVRENCDFLMRIPMFGRVSSLNVSVAAGLFFYEARRQRALFQADKPTHVS